MIEFEPIIERSREVLARNDRGNFTVPNGEIFETQFLWDSCIMAEALAYDDPQRAVTEIKSLLRAQQPNGMIPNEVNEKISWGHKHIFGTEVSEDGYIPSGITQPPIIARAVMKVGEHLKIDERKQFYKDVFEPIKRYHDWLLTERVIDETGLVTLIHPYESGMDNIPYWRNPMHEYWLGDRQPGDRAKHFVMEKTVAGYRKLFADTRHVPVSQRSDHKDVLSSFLQSRRTAAHGHNLQDIWDSTDIPVQQDVGFNALLVQGNTALLEMERVIDEDEYCVDAELLEKMKQLEYSINDVLWDGNAKCFYSRDAREGKLIKVNTISGLLPLVMDLDPDIQDVLVERIFDPEQYWTNVPIPSVAVNDPEFRAGVYWLGSAWPMPAVLIESELPEDKASKLRIKRVTRPNEAEKTEYHHPLNGEALGIPDFGPTAAEASIFAHKEMATV